MFTAIRRDVTERFSEVFQLIDLIRQGEVAPPDPDPAEIRVLRGLFHVHLYAALEFSVNKGIQRYLEELDALNIIPTHFDTRIFSIALDPSFASIRNVSEEKRWLRRLELLSLQSSSTPQKIAGAIFGLYLQNVWFERLETVFSCLAIDQPVVPNPNYRFYIDELVNNRNAVAHGRFSAMGIGSANRSPELFTRYNAINDTCVYILDCLEHHYNNRGAVLAAHRDLYP